ncbi:MAG: phytanoyl-CoA dioxygenase [Candidatus Latescibacteria bacterium]|nr:phytanoyl-CoA dioxygenase [Candidatus Latescibacterota bacterium]
MVDPQYLFDDDQMRAFIVNGFVTIKLDLPAGFHEAIYRKTDEVYAKEGNPGNNILPRVPELKQIFDHPRVRGAFTSILGPDHIMHAHRHCHVNPPGSKGQGWHKDTYWGYKKVRYHRPRWAMAFYYPQDVTIENGTSEVMPGTHYHLIKPLNDAERAMPVCGEAGTLAIIHFDLWHRGGANRSERNRFMMKFQFTRMEEPQGPAWNVRDAAWRSPASVPDDRLDPLWSRVWDWCSGKKTNGSGEASRDGIPALASALRDEEESVRLSAAYALGAAGEPAISPLAEALRSNDEPTRLSATYGLGIVGETALPPLSDALKHEDEQVRACAAYAVGDIGPDAAEAVSALAEALLKDPSPWVRHHAAEALGTIALNPGVSVPALGRALRDPDGQVRFNAAYALAHFGPAAEPAIPALREALTDDNRYAVGHAVSALRRIGTPEAEEALLDFLTATRWCPITTKESMY